MKIKHIEFISSSPSIKKCPENDLPEFAFIGRSNVGKSSLINMLTGRRGLAKVSGTPGKTRHINHFRISTELKEGQAVDWYLVDLPGYGYARLPKTVREKFDGTIRDYILKRESLAVTFLLIDARLEPQRSDIEFASWLGASDLAFVMVFTKADKLTRSALELSVGRWKEELGREWAEPPLMLITSSSQATGRQEVLEFIGNALKEIGGPVI